MKLTNGEYTLRLSGGGLEIVKNNAVLYENRKPVYIFVLDYLAITRFYDEPYTAMYIENDALYAQGKLTTPGGTVFTVKDCYTLCGSGFAVSRNVIVEKTGTDERGFASKFTLRPTASANLRDYNCFAPGVWYKQNDRVPPHFIGYNFDFEYYHWTETRCALPLFAMQNITSGEAVCLSRLAADVTLRSMVRPLYTNYVDPTYTIGAVGMSQPKNKTLFYDEMNTTITRLPLEREDDPLGIDYLYPASYGEIMGRPMAGVGMNPHRRQIPAYNRMFHPIRIGFTDHYGAAMEFGCFENFRAMMRTFWRSTDARLRAPLADTNCALLYKNNMKLLRDKCRKFNNSWGLPFLSFLPDCQDQNVDYQLGFVGQQTNIAYQLIRYGDRENDREAYDKGVAILDFWCSRGITPSGAPQLWFNPPLDEFQPEPFWTRMIGDGLEGILDAYVYLRKKGDEHSLWYNACRATADWLLRVQNTDGSFYRSYDENNRMCMDSKSNTTAVIRFLVQFYLVTGEKIYRDAAISAGEWSYKNIYLAVDYRGGTCDNSDVYDKESAIYGIFGFLSLYDLTGEKRWLDAACGAADYAATWTYTWSFPIVTGLPVHAFNKGNISGQSLIATGHSAADLYMAACSFVYYRLYIYTDDEYYLHFAEFLSKNPQQANDVDGSAGYAIPGLCHEATSFYDQVLQGQFQWLPWCTYVEADPVSRLYDAFGVYEIADAQRLPLSQRRKMNRIYDTYL